jgi:small subunit ribosomal protein S15
MITSEKKSKIVSDLGSSKNDSGAPAVQVGIMTARVAELTEHLKTHKHDHASRRALLQLVGKRKRHLKYIAQKDGDAYLALIKKLGIRR